jgi:hypothetical protein
MPKRKKQTQEPAPEDADAEAHIDDAPEAEPQNANNEPDEPEEKEDDPNKIAKARKRRRGVARRKGYRHLANRAGYSATLPSADASRDVTSNLLSIGETARACRWTPRLPNATSYGKTGEYQDRLQLSTEPLPPGAVGVVRANAEVFARKTMNEAVQRAFDAGKTRVSANIMMSVLRPMAPVLRYSFAAPMGLVRHAQTTIIGPADNPDKQSPALGFGDEDEAQMKAEASFLPKQQELAKASAKKESERKAKRKKERKAAKEKRDAEAAAAKAGKA